MVAETVRGKALRFLVPAAAELAVPEHFFVEVAAVLRRWEMQAVLTPAQAADGLDRLLSWPLRRARLDTLLRSAWSYRQNLTVADGLYVALADRLGASLLTDDQHLVGSPTFPKHIPTLVLP